MNTSKSNALFSRTKAGARQRGQGMTEYIIIVCLIAVGGIAIFTFFGNTLRNHAAAMTLELGGNSGSAQVTTAGTESLRAGSAAAAITSLKSYGGQQPSGS